MTELPTNNENELLQEEWEDLLDETFLDEITADMKSRLHLKFRKMKIGRQ